MLSDSWASAFSWKRVSDQSISVRFPPGLARIEVEVFGELAHDRVAVVQRGRADQARRFRAGDGEHCPVSELGDVLPRLRDVREREVHGRFEQAHRLPRDIGQPPLEAEIQNRDTRGAQLHKLAQRAFRVDDARPGGSFADDTGEDLHGQGQHQLVDLLSPHGPRSRPLVGVRVEFAALELDRRHPAVGDLHARQLGAGDDFDAFTFERAAQGRDEGFLGRVAGQPLARASRAHAVAQIRLGVLRGGLVPGSDQILAMNVSHALIAVSVM